jgi:hypothetical protein
MINPSKLVLGVALAVWMGLLIACGGGQPAPTAKKASSSKPAKFASQSSNKDWPYKFVQTKKDPKSPDGDIMDLFAYSGPLDIKQLKAFCKARKEQSKAKLFYFAVLFDNAENAVFPSNPFTAEYGIDEDALKHIRAIYTYNRKNGYSELRHYDTNAWEGKAQKEKI